MPRHSNHRNCPKSFNPKTMSLWDLQALPKKLVCNLVTTGGKAPLAKQIFYQLSYQATHWLTGRYELNQLTSLPMCGFMAQLVQHRTGIAEVTGSNPIEALFFQTSFQLIKLKNLLWWSFFTFIYNCSTHMNYFIYPCHTALIRLYALWAWNQVLSV